VVESVCVIIESAFSSFQVKELANLGEHRLFRSGKVPMRKGSFRIAADISRTIGSEPRRLSCSGVKADREQMRPGIEARLDANSLSSEQSWRVTRGQKSGEGAARIDKVITSACHETGQMNRPPSWLRS